MSVTVALDEEHDLLAVLLGNRVESLIEAQMEAICVTSLV